MAGATRQKEAQGCVIGSKITRSELTQIQDLIDASVYLNASDFVRDAIRDKLAAIKVIKCRDVDYETAKKEITGYFQRKMECYEEGDALHGAKIYAEARKMAGPAVIVILN